MIDCPRKQTKFLESEGIVNTKETTEIWFHLVVLLLSHGR